MVNSKPRSCFFNMDRMGVSEIIRATNTYHPPSINKAIHAMINRSPHVKSGWTNWLKIAIRNTSIFGLRKAIRKPSVKPRLLEFLYSNSSSEPLIIIAARMIRNNPPASSKMVAASLALAFSCAIPAIATKA